MPENHVKALESIDYVDMVTTNLNYEKPHKYIAHSLTPSHLI